METLKDVCVSVLSLHIKQWMLIKFITSAISDCIQSVLTSYLSFPYIY